MLSRTLLKALKTNVLKIRLMIELEKLPVQGSSVESIVEMIEIDDIINR